MAGNDDFHWRKGKGEAGPAGTGKTMAAVVIGR